MSKKGTATAIALRATAVLLIVLGVWLLFHFVALMGADYDAARAWVAKPFNGGVLAAFIGIGAWHARMGMAEIIIDYVRDWPKDVLLFLNWLVAMGAIIVSLWAIYSLSFAG